MMNFLIENFGWWLNGSKVIFKFINYFCFILILIFDFLVDLIELLNKCKYDKINCDWLWIIISS